MPRTIVTRSLLALLPILGAAFAALAGMQGWPALPSLLAMVAVACASAVIYWSRPLVEVKSAEIPRQLAPPQALAAVALPEPVIDLPATAPPVLAVALSESDAPELVALQISTVAEPPTSDTRAEQLAGEGMEHDLLTGLLAPECFFSRFTARLDRCDAAGQTAVLVLCDVDRFGELNRTAGLVDANRLLRSIADSFRLTVREGDLLARLGSDEFALFFPGLSPDIAESRVRDLRAAVREAALLTLDGDAQHVTMSVGISCYPRDGESGEVLFEAADVALQAAKRLRADQAGQPVASAVVLTRVQPPALISLRTESY